EKFAPVTRHLLELPFHLAVGDERRWLCHMEHDQPRLLVAGQRAGEAEGVLRIVRQVGGIQDRAEGQHDVLLVRGGGKLRRYGRSTIVRTQEQTACRKEHPPGNSYAWRSSGHRTRAGVDYFPAGGQVGGPRNGEGSAARYGHFPHNGCAEREYQLRRSEP